MENKTLLIVDDTISNLTILCNLLENYDVLTATSGTDALEIVDEENIDLILLDILMPDMNGFEVCKILKSKKETQNIPIIFITSDSSEDSIEKGYEVGGIDYITKPFKPKELLACVTTQLDLIDKTHNLESLISKQIEQLRAKDALLMEQSKKAEMGQMIANIAHQLKQPLNVISAMMSNVLIEDMVGKEINIDELCLNVQDEITFMSETIDMYRTFFSTNTEKEYTILNKIIDDTLKILGGNILNIIFIKEYQENLSKIKIYPNEIVQCIMNIIKNAQDNQDHKKIPEKIIKISTYDDSEYQVITIHDNGGGVPQDIQDRIFENYFTTKSKDNGTGIGLHLVKQIIEKKHNGKVFVENEKLEYDGKLFLGAKFIIKLKKVTIV